MAHHINKMAIHLQTLKSGNQTLYGCEPRLQSWCGARHRKGSGRSRLSVSVCLINRLTTMWTDLSPSELPSVSPSSVVFIHACFSPRLSFVPLLSMPTSPRRCGFPGLMRVGCFSRCCMCVCGWCRPVLAGPASHHQTGAGWGLLSWSPLALHYQLERLCDELQRGGFLRGEPEQSSAGEWSAWPGLLMLDNKQTQQFSWVSHTWRGRRGCEPRRKSLESAGYNNLWRVCPPECVLCLCVWNVIQN